MAPPQRRISMALLAGCVLLLAVDVVVVRATAEAEQANPLRKVVGLLQGLSKEVEAEGEKSKELYEKFMCYCETTEATTTKSVEEARAQITSLEAQIKELSGSNAQLEQEVTDLKSDIEENTKGVEEATGVRKKEASEFATESAEMTNSVAALDKAIPALQAGMPPDAALLTQIGARLLARGGGTELTKQIMLQLQSGKQPAGGSSQILGVLEQMRDDFKANLNAATKEEEETQATYDELMAAKGKQITASTRELEEKQGRLATQKQSLADASADHEDTQESLAEDEKFLFNLKTQCATKTKEYEAEEKERQMEIIAIADTIKILNDDDAQEMFKKTLPSPGGAAAASFLQTGMKVRRRGLPASIAEASRFLDEAGSVEGGSHSGELRLVAAQMRHQARRQPDEKFAPLKKSVSDMMAALQQEQVDDDKHKDYCTAEMASVKDEKEGLNADIDGLQTKITDAQATITTLKEEIASLKLEIGSLDANLNQATAQRKEEAAVHKQTMAELQVSSSLLNKAKERLSQFYAPQALLQTRQQAAATEDERWAQSLLGGDDSSDGKSGTTALAQQPGGRGGQGMGIVGMLETLQGELKTQMAVGNQEEAQAQKDYEEFSADTAAAREAKSKQVVDKNGNLATIAEAVQDLSTQKDESNTELSAVLDKLQAITQDCSFLLENYEVRKKARGTELESLNNALAILSGADFSFVQLQQKPSRRLRRALRHGRRTH